MRDIDVKMEPGDARLILHLLNRHMHGLRRKPALTIEGNQRIAYKIARSEELKHHLEDALRGAGYSTDVQE